MPHDSRSQVLELGRLDEQRRFIPYSDGDMLEIHQGLQGGFHVFVDGRVLGEPQGRECRVALRIARAEDDQPVGTIEHLRVPDLRLDDEGYETLEDMIVFIPEPAAVDGREVVIEASLDSGGGGEFAEATTMVLELAPSR